MGNRDIGTQPKPDLDVENYFITHWDLPRYKNSFKFKGATKLFGQRIVKVNILLDNTLKIAPRLKQTSLRWWGCPNLSGPSTRFSLSPSLVMDMVKDKYMKV